MTKDRKTIELLSMLEDLRKQCTTLTQENQDLRELLAEEAFTSSELRKTIRFLHTWIAE